MSPREKTAGIAAAYVAFVNNLPGTLEACGLEPDELVARTEAAAAAWERMRQWHLEPVDQD